MGNSGSRTSGQVLSKTPAAFQPQEPPYPGPCAQYQFVNTQVTMTTPIHFSFSVGEMVTSNVDAYYPVLAQTMDQGYRLLTFYHIPGEVQRTGGLFSQSVNMPFQGIFCRYPQQPEQERYQLRIEKSVIQPQFMYTGIISTHSQVYTDTSHLFQTIANNTQNGGRLVCIELTGQETTQISFSMHQRMPMKGVDLFFEYPMSGRGETYMYNVVNAPIQVSYSAGLRPTPVVHCDWLGILAQNLGQGYRLVEIFMDETQSTQAGFLTASAQMNSQWFFEKPASRANDPTPMYQGTVVEHEIAISQSGLSGARTTTNWEMVMQDMGNRGWELACILETPEISPDLAPSDFHLFGPLKRHSGGMAFETEDDLISELRNWFDNLDIDFFRVGINSLLSRRQKCIDLHGDYVEK
ncbi:raftlin-like [Plakobranchus ocellatus]|uniref:Raftlin-like n=1 Tax=Plakobranchus ocellatus TaxID=259542 RepID=A0AAV3YGY8_9GAST|nr:raftlin-like [Plakobranchus ocellatus]